jgi:photosystem II stability/assembly factor-like uncharacterized protein
VRSHGHRALPPSYNYEMALRRHLRSVSVGLALGPSTLGVAACGAHASHSTGAAPPSAAVTGGGTAPTSGTATTTTMARATTTASPGSRPATTTMTASAPGGRAPAGGPVPAGSRAASVSFLSPDLAFVLGTAPCTQAPCSEILRSSDRGAVWVGLPAPRESVSQILGAGLWGLRFADPRHGFAYGAGLWQTSDGAASWQRVPAPARSIIDLEPVADRALLAVASDCGQGRVNDCGPEVLYRRPVTRDTWTRVRTLAGQGAGAAALSATITVRGDRVWVLDPRGLLLSEDGGRHFHSVGQPCHQRSAEPSGPVSLADDGSDTFLLCVGSPGAGSAPKSVYRLRRGGWQLVGRPPAGGDGSLQLAAGSDRGLILSASSGASWLYRSTDAGARWGTALRLDSGGVAWGDLGFTTAEDGVVIEGPAGAGAGASPSVEPGRLYLTEDGGRHWSRSRF